MWGSSPPKGATPLQSMADSEDRDNTAGSAPSPHPRSSAGFSDDDEVLVVRQLPKPYAAKVVKVEAPGFYHAIKRGMKPACGVDIGAGETHCAVPHSTAIQVG